MDSVNGGDKNGTILRTADEKMTQKFAIGGLHHPSRALFNKRHFCLL